MNRLAALLTWLSCWLCLSFFVFSFSFAQQPQGLVSDYAGVLQPQQRQQLEAYLRLFRDSTSNEIAVAIFPALPEGEVLEDYVTRLYEQWGIGQAKQNNGVLIALFVQDRKARIEVGYGLEPVITDQRANQIYQERMRPQFQQGRYYEGLAAGVQTVAQLAAQEFKTPIRRSRAPQAQPNVGLALIIVLVILAIGYWIHRNSGGGGPRGGGRSRRYDDGPGIFFLPTGWGGGGGFGGGFGGGDGGFGGFGGGMSGGGGASGDW